jgi:hypothetical protein
MRMTRLLQSILCAAALTGCGSVGGGNGNVDVVLPKLDFGLTDCGTTAVPHTLVVSNDSDKAFSYTAELAMGEDSYYTVTPAQGTVLAHSQLYVTVTSRPIPATSPVTPDLYADTLTVTTDKDGDEPHQVAITQTARGFVLEFDSSVVDFGAPLQLGSSAEAPLMITNTGNAPAEIALVRSGPEFNADLGDGPIAPGATVASMLTFMPGFNAENSGTLTFVAGGSAPQCGAPATVSLSGKGTAVNIAAQAVPTVQAGRMNSSPGVSTICVRTVSGHVACTGSNEAGARGASYDYVLSIGNTGNGKGGQTVPGFDSVNLVQTKDGYLDNVVDLAGGASFYCALRQGGEEWCWGDYNGYGRAVTDNRGTPNPLRDHLAAELVTSGVINVSGGYTNRCHILAANNRFSCSSRRIGNGVLDMSGWTVTGATDSATNGATAFAVVGGEVYSWGLNHAGERGYAADDNGPGDKIPSFTGVVQVRAGAQNINRSNGRWACARKMDGTVWCWGRNSRGNLGNGTSSDATTPVQVTKSDATALTAITSITVGHRHGCALSGGTVQCWGRGSEGEIGSGNTASTVARAETVTGLTAVTQIEANHTNATCAVLTSHAIRCWGKINNVEYVEAGPLEAFSH